MAIPPGVTVYPTAYDWQHSPWASQGPGREFGPDSAKALGEANPASRGSSYYFGFLVTLAILLLVGVICGIATRRRHLARRQQRGMDPVIDQAAVARLRRFGGLFGMDRVEEDYPQDKAKIVPKLHDVQLNGGIGESSGGHSKGTRMGVGGSSGVGNSAFQGSRSNPWAEITPLSASLVRAPKDLEPYAHIERALVASNSRSSPRVVDAPPPYSTSHSETGNESTMRMEDTERAQKRWLPRLSSSRWFSSQASRSEDAAAYQLSSMPLGRTTSSSSPTWSNNLRTLDLESGANSSSTSTLLGDESDVKMEVAVVVTMPDRPAKPSSTSLPEYEIGVAMANLGKP